MHDPLLFTAIVIATYTNAKLAAHYVHISVYLSFCYWHNAVHHCYCTTLFIDVLFLKCQLVHRDISATIWFISNMRYIKNLSIKN